MDSGGRRNDSLRAELLQCCLAAFSDAAGRQLPRVILANLFGLEGFHIAEALECSFVAASPCLVPYSSASFEQRFSNAFPQLFARLQESSPGTAGLKWPACLLL